MTLARLYRRTIHEWQAWRTRRRLYRALPELRYFDAAEKDARRNHSKTKHIQKAREAFMRNALSGGRT